MCTQQICTRLDEDVARAAVKPHLPALLACLRMAPDCALSHSRAWLEPFVGLAACWIAAEECEARRREEMSPVDTNAGTVSPAVVRCASFDHPGCAGLQIECSSCVLTT